MRIYKSEQRSQDGYISKAVAVRITVLWTVCIEGTDYFCLAIKLIAMARNVIHLF